MAKDTVISVQSVIQKFKEALNDDYGYIYGKTHEMWSQAKQEAYNKAKANDSNCQMSIKYGSKWYGHWVTDCSGLFAWAFDSLGSYMFHGSNTMYKSWCVDKGTLSKGKRTDGYELKPGTAVFTGKSENDHPHVGLYVGDGYVIEAKGTQAGVIKTPVTDSKWTYWGELKNLDYDAPVQPEPDVPEGYAVVTGKQVALRSAPTTQASIILRVATGKKVKLETPPPDEWQYVSFSNKKGYMMKKYLEERG